MRDFLRPLPDEERRARYRVTVGDRVEPGSLGLAYESAGSRRLLSWSSISHVIAAEVGEPEGVRTIVFDLLREEGNCWQVLRLDAEPGDEAMDLAVAIVDHTPSTRQSASLKSIAADGLPTLWFPDLVSFEEATLSEIR